MTLKLLILMALSAQIFAAPSNNINYEDLASKCDEEKCVLPDCRCISTDIPGGLDVETIPQFVFFTFDDAVETTNHEYYKQAFYNKTNPDGCPVQGTFFMSHDYTEYDIVNDLYNNGQEIALHSVTHFSNTEYWKNITVDGLVGEFGDERTIITNFANVPEEEIHGMRLPFLQLSGDNSFEAGKQLGLSYDCSWPTGRLQPGLWPYTLDYKTDQDCSIGPCPTASIPGMWVVPMLEWNDQQNISCSMVDACVNIPDDVDGIYQWFIENFEKQYLGNKAPFGFYVHAAYFQVAGEHADAYFKFIDYLQGLEDVYLVGVNSALKWIQNPVPIGSPDWPACHEVEPTKCESVTCELAKGEETRYMRSCTGCPLVYPWLGDPLGENETLHDLGSRFSK